MQKLPAARFFQGAVSHAAALLGRCIKSPFHRRKPELANSKHLDIFDLSAVTRYIAKTDPAMLEWRVEDAEADPAGAARMMLGMLREHDLRRRFPKALSEGEKGAFFQWIKGTGCSLRAQENIRKAFRAEPARRVMHLYLQLPSLHKSQPLAVTPAGGRHFVKWLLKQGREKYRLRDEEILWFLQQAGENPLPLLVTHYLIQPDWQMAHPCALTAAGCQDWIHWLMEKHHLRRLKPAETLCVHRPVDELRLLHQHRPELQEEVAQPFLSLESTHKLAASIARDVPRSMAKSWRKNLEDDLEAGLSQQPGVNVIAHFSYPSGLQRAAYTITEALQSHGYRISRRDLPAGLRSDTLDRSPHLGVELFDITLSVIAPFETLAKRYQQSGLPMRPGVHRIGVWYWELDQLPPEWIERAASMQELWAPSRFIANAMRPVMPVPVIEMPPGVQMTPAAPCNRAGYGLQEDDFLFMFMFDMCSVMERKNPLGLIRAFKKAFDGQKGVALAVKVLRGGAFPEDFARLQAAATDAGVTLIDQALTQEDAQGLLNICDAYVSLHRSEGFGLTMAEAMLLGKPVIATNYSGNTDFMTAENSLLVDYHLVPITNNLQFYSRGNRWAEPSEEDAARKMRWVFEHRDEARAMGARAQQDASALFSLESAARRMTDRLQQIRASRHAGAGQPAPVPSPR